MSKLRCTVSANYGGYFFKTCTCMHLVPIKIKACNCKWILQNQWDGAIMYLRSHSSFFWLAGNKLTLLNYFEIFIFIFWTFIFIINNIITNISVQIFALCCAVTGVILTFDIYTGDTYYAHKNTSDIVKNLVIVSELSENTGYKLFTDNYYTTLKVIQILYEQFKWLVCGTVVMKKRKKKDSSYVTEDYPWRKMTIKGVVSFLKCGFSWIATQAFYIAPNSKYVVQATMLWKEERWLDDYIL